MYWTIMVKELSKKCQKTGICDGINIFKWDSSILFFALSPLPYKQTNKQTNRHTALFYVYLIYYNHVTCIHTYNIGKISNLFEYRISKKTVCIRKYMVSTQPVFHGTPFFAFAFVFSNLLLYEINSILVTNACRRRKYFVNKCLMYNVNKLIFCK